jgi:putative transposase
MAIAVEDLNVAGMVRNHCLAKAISRTGWAEFRGMLAYKAHRDGRTLAVVDRWYPSSKTCSNCGHLLAHLSLSTRTWQCPSCGTRHDRDHNAARNIMVAAGLVETGNACGAGVRHDGRPSVRPAVNQETQPVKVGIPRL